MTDEQGIYFRDLFRDSRLAALKDAEGFTATLFALERLGKFLNSRESTLARLKRDILRVAEFSTLAQKIPAKWPDFHTSFGDLFNQFREARNSAFHEGALARHLTSHAILLSIILEDALMDGRDQIGDYMVRMPTCACMWHPLSFIRQTLLANSYSYLPVNSGTETKPDWWLISDCSLAHFLHTGNHSDRKKRLGMTLQEAVESYEKLLTRPFICQPDTSLTKVLTHCENHPALVLSTDNQHLLGIATAFDIL